ncbi:MAG: serine hydrolase, partial [Clostridia bacterium]|nr:serine hydrolase [Clostridia bacterium]
MLSNIVIDLEKKWNVTCGCAIYDADTDECIVSYKEDLVFKSASLIKTPIMMCALEDVESGKLTLDTIIHVEDKQCVGDEAPVIKDGYDVPLSVLLEYMITESNNSATNCLIDYFTMDKVNAYSAKTGLENTLLRRHMLDYESARQGRENLTNAKDMKSLYEMLYTQTTFTPFQCETAIPILLRQKDKELLMDSNPAQKAAHKTGGLSDIAHDA